ncbi:hypothetical protein BD769DRAFT_1674863 [Suillus cothurnatus]|nr:hypothetical protein BD769DRAFT_1674863 [Suillus cothurnatus]
MAYIVFGQRDCIGFDLTITINPKMTSLLSGAFWARNVKGLPKRSNQAACLKSCRPYSLDAQTELTQSHALDTTQTIFHSLPDQLPSPAKFTDEPRTDSSPLVDLPDLKNTKDDDVIGKITVNENVYELLKVIFCNQGLVGRGTVCYLAQRDGEEFIIKDHWVKGDKTIVLNEVEMLKTLKDIPGVPQYIETLSCRGVYCMHVHLVLKPRARPLLEFQTRKELVKALRDIVLIQKHVVEEHQVLHRDCSLNNSMIEDTKDGSQGALIDWEFAVHITSDNMYSAGGTGTIPFMSVSALRAMGKLNYQYSQVMKSIKELKLATDHSTPEKMPKIKHTYHDNLESMFYVFAQICIMFKGPMGEERCLEDVMDHDPEKMEIEQFAPYFKKLVPLAEEWYDLMGVKKMKVEFDEVVSLFNKHINDLLDEENNSEELSKKAKRLGDGKEEENDDTLAPSKRTKLK